MNVLGMGPLELMLIVVLALIVFGPAKLPEIMGQIGRAIGDFRRATSELSDEFNRTIQSELQETRAVVDETRAAVQEATSAVREAHTAVGEAGAAVTTLPAPVRVASATPQPTLNGTDTPVEPAAANGPIEPQPPLADTTQWSWETAAPPTDREPEPPAPTIAPPPVSEAEPSPTIEPPAAETPPPAPKPKRKRAAPKRDELAPPY